MKAALIIGRAQCVWEDLESANYLLQEIPHEVIVINVVGRDYDAPIDHWVSFHPELLPNWIAERERNMYPGNYQLWTSSRGRKMTSWEVKLGIKFVECEGGSSGMIALKVALHLGCTHIILAGVPMDNTYGQYDTGKDWDEADMHWLLWRKLPLEVKEKVRSMSGRTRHWFGYPTESWLERSSDLHPSLG